MCSCDQKKVEQTTVPSTTETTTEVTDNFNDDLEPETTDYYPGEGSKSDSDETETTETTTKAKETQKSEETTKSTTVTYYSESPDNKYIKYIAGKYNVDPAVLRALIRTNTDTPGATVLQFDGSKDSKGNLLMTADTLVCVYDVSSNGNIKKATGKATGNEGYSYIESLAAFTVVQKYMIPNIEATKAQRTYEDYYKN